MDYRIEWSPEAIEDIESIIDYIAKDSEYYARSVVTKIIDCSRSLLQFPFIGRIVPEIEEENIRECLFYSYRLIYRVDNDTILVVAVIHGRRLLESIIQRL